MTDFLTRIDDLNVWKKGSRRAPHKPLLLLVALGRLQRGEERMAALLTALEDGGGIQKAIPSAYGMTLDELEQEWLGQITGGSSVTIPSDPGTVGTSVIITGAVAVAAVAVIIRWLRRITSASSGEETLE